MMRFIFFTKSVWDEAPRLRHQLAQLLSDAGHSVIFFQKPSYPWRVQPAPRRGVASIQFVDHRELVHHKLRVSSVLYGMNAVWARREIRRAAENHQFDDHEIVVNFNYDYAFLRDLFPRNRLITIINDDSWSGALLGYDRPLRRTLARTCRLSDHVLTVSHHLARQLSDYCSPGLFLPWTFHEYSEPTPDTERDTLLFWGYINWKIDLDHVMHLSDVLLRNRSNVRMLFVGPEEIDRQGSKLLRSASNIEIRSAAPLEQLSLDRVIAGFIPYRGNVPSIDAIFLPNKALHLLVKGLPLIVSGMPEFLKAPFVFRMKDAADTATILEAKHRLFAVQPEIKQFVSEHGAASRLRDFLKLAL